MLSITTFYACSSSNIISKFCVSSNLASTLCPTRVQSLHTWAQYAHFSFHHWILNLLIPTSSHNISRPLLALWLSGLQSSYSHPLNPNFCNIPTVKRRGEYELMETLKFDVAEYLKVWLIRKTHSFHLHHLLIFLTVPSFSHPLIGMSQLSGSPWRQRFIPQTFWT